VIRTCLEGETTGEGRATKTVTRQRPIEDLCLIFTERPAMCTVVVYDCTGHCQCLTPSQLWLCAIDIRFGRLSSSSCAKGSLLSRAPEIEQDQRYSGAEDFRNFYQREGGRITKKTRETSQYIFELAPTSVALNCLIHQWTLKKACVCDRPNHYYRSVLPTPSRLP
jgi:hypothetical protein